MARTTPDQHPPFWLTAIRMAGRQPPPPRKLLNPALHRPSAQPNPRAVPLDQPSSLLSSLYSFFPLLPLSFFFSRIYLFIYLLQLSRLSSWENSPSPENRCRNYNDCIIRKKYTHIFEYKIHSTEFIYIYITALGRRKAFIFLVVRETRRKRENSKIDRRWRDAWRGSRYTDGGREPRGLGPRAL